MKTDPELELAATGVRGPLTLENALFQARKASRLAPLQVVRADRVVGLDHLRSAAAHARRAFEEGRNKANDLPVEFARYLSGRRTIREALEHVGVPDRCDEAVVVAFGPKAQDAVAYFADMLGLDEDDAILEATPEKLAAFGLPPALLAATPERLRYDRVLEAVAAVDLMRN